MKKTGVSIVDLTAWESGRLEWTVQKWYISDHDEKVITFDCEYHTNEYGLGLWIGDKQIVGTMDFHYSAKDPRRSFYRIFAVTEHDLHDMEWDERERYLSPAQKEQEQKENERFELVERIAWKVNMVAELEDSTFEELREYKQDLMRKNGVTEDEVTKWAWLFDGQW